MSPVTKAQRAASQQQALLWFLRVSERRKTRVEVEGHFICGAYSRTGTIMERLKALEQMGYLKRTVLFKGEKNKRDTIQWSFTAHGVSRAKIEQL